MRRELSGFRLLLLDLALELERLRRKLFAFRFLQEGVETAAMVDRLQGVCRNAQPDRAAERVRHQRNVQQVWQKPPLGLDIRVADLVANQGALAGQLATARHGEILGKMIGNPAGPIQHPFGGRGPIKSAPQRVKLSGWPAIYHRFDAFPAEDPKMQPPDAGWLARVLLAKTGLKAGAAPRGRIKRCVTADPYACSLA